MMNRAAKLLLAGLAGLAGLGGIGIGVGATEIAHAAAKAPAFQIVEFEITDPAGF